jgi:hypothetical protein
VVNSTKRLALPTLRYTMIAAVSEERQKVKTIPQSELEASEAQRRGLLAHIPGDYKKIGNHTLVMISSLVSIWVVHYTLSALLGKNAAFFDIIPIRYVIDVGDLLIIGNFFRHLVQDFREKK